MLLVSFNPYRSMGLSGVTYLKPEAMFREGTRIAEADWVLFPEYWQVNALVYGMGRRIFPSLRAYHMGHDKTEETRALWAVCPEHVPHTLILPSTEAGIEEGLASFTFPFVAKEVRSSMGEGVFLIRKRSELLAYARANEVLYLQEYLPITRDLRVALIGDSVVAAYWREGGDGFHFNVARGGDISLNDVPMEACRLVERVARRLGVDHAGFDVAEVDGHFYFLEFNVFFGMAGLEKKGVSVGPLILEYLSRTSSTQDDPAMGPRRAA